MRVALGRHLQYSSMLTVQQMVSNALGLRRGDSQGSEACRVPASMQTSLKVCRVPESNAEVFKYAEFPQLCRAPKAQHVHQQSGLGRTRQSRLVLHTVAIVGKGFQLWPHPERGVLFLFFIVTHLDAVRQKCISILTSTL